MKLKLMAMIAAVAAFLSGTATARTITVTENKDANGLTTSFSLTFSADSATHSLWMAWGDSDGGTASIADWENSKPLGLVSGDMTAWPYAVPVPDGWGETVSHLRFVLIEGAGCSRRRDAGICRGHRLAVRNDGLYSNVYIRRGDDIRVQFKYIKWV